MNFSYLSLEELNDIMRDKDFIINSDEFIQISNYVSKNILPLCSMEQVATLSKSFQIMMENKTKSFANPVVKEVHNKFPKLFIPITIHEFRSFYKDFCSLDVTSPEFNKTLFELTYHAFLFDNAGMLPDLTSRYPDLPFLTFRRLYDFMLHKNI